MLGFAYKVPDRLRGPGFPTRTYESIRRNRPRVIDNLRQVHASNMAYIDRNCVVYVAVNKINNKLYVGATSKGLSYRMKGHFNDANRASYSGKSILISAIRKYGKDAFEFLIFAVCRDFKRALYGEQELIAAIMPEYNLTAGGEGMTGWKPSEDTLRRLSESHLGIPGFWAGKKRSSESIEKMVATRRAEGSYTGPMRGKKHSPETIKKLRAAKAGTNFPYLSPEVMAKRTESVRKENLRRQKPVRCIDDGLVFVSIKLAAAHYNIAMSHMGRVLHGEAKSAHGRRFEFV